MATYGEIVANRDWFVSEIAVVNRVADLCTSAQFQISCMHITEWPDELTAYKTAYDNLLTTMSETTEIGYATGVSRLKALAEGLHATGKAYLTVEAANESAIATQVQDLLRNF